MTNKNPVKTRQFRDSQGRFARVSRETARKAGREGGIASAAKRREQKSAAELCRLIDSQPMTSKGFVDGLRSLGVDEEVISRLDQKTARIFSLQRECLKGNVKAIELWLKLTGEYEDTKNINITGTPLSDGVVTFSGAGDDQV